MNKEKIIELMKANTIGSDENARAENFASYIIRLELDKDKAGKPKNAWMKGRTEQQMVDLYNRVSADGLVFDGKHITLQSTGVSYDYVAYKNKMFLAYPESKIDMELIFKGDTFNFAKESGSIIYHHEIANPLTRNDGDIIGAYCVIQNQRGEFMTILNKDEIEKHRKVAKTDYIWKEWFKEMCLKTIIKKACKKHFDDIYEKIETLDNDNYDLDIPVSIELKYKQEIDELKTMEELTKYYQSHKGLGADVDKYLAMKKAELSK